MRILVCGDRKWNNLGMIMQELGRYEWDKTVIIQGCAKGADSIAKFTAEQYGMEIESYPAKWDLYGRAAGPVRNKQMLDEGKPDLVLAFHNDIENSKGTKDMVLRARKAGIKVRIFKDGLSPR